MTKFLFCIFPSSYLTIPLSSTPHHPAAPCTPDCIPFLCVPLHPFFSTIIIEQNIVICMFWPTWFMCAAPQQFDVHDLWWTHAAAYHLDSNRINWRGSHLIQFSYLNTNICFVASSVWTSVVEFFLPPLYAGNENSKRTRKAHVRVGDTPTCDPPCSSFCASMKIEPHVFINDKDMRVLLNLLHAWKLKHLL